MLNYISYDDWENHVIGLMN